MNLGLLVGTHRAGDTKSKRGRHKQLQANNSGGRGWWWKRLPGAGGREEPAPPGLVAEVNKHPEPITLTAPGGGRDEGAHGLWQRAPLS